MMNTELKKLIQQKVDGMKVGEEKEAKEILGEEIWDEIPNPKGFGKIFKKAVEEGEIEKLEHVTELPNSKRHDMYRRVEKKKNARRIKVSVKELFDSKKNITGLMIMMFFNKKVATQSKRKIEDFLQSYIEHYYFPNQRYSYFCHIEKDLASIVVLNDNKSDTTEKYIDFPKNLVED